MGLKTTAEFMAMLTRTNLRYLRVLLRIVNEGSPLSDAIFKRFSQFYPTFPKAVAQARERLATLEDVLGRYMKEKYGE